MSDPNKACWKRDKTRKDESNHTGRYILATSDGHHVDVVADEKEDDFWQFWERNDKFYDLVAVCYKANPDVEIYPHEKDGVAESESDDEG